MQVRSHEIEPVIPFLLLKEGWRQDDFVIHLSFHSNFIVEANLSDVWITGKDFSSDEYFLVLISLLIFYLKDHESKNGLVG